MEEWRDIEGYEGLYQISNKGCVKSLERINYQNRWQRERILVFGNNGRGYANVALVKNGKSTTFLVHRLVAKAFLENPNNYPCVNHKDENPSNNIVDNLEWCTYKYNDNYGTRKLKIAEKHGKPVIGTCESGSVERYKSLSEAARILMGSSGGAANISAAIKNHWIAYGRRWRYESEVSN